MHYSKQKIKKQIVHEKLSMTFNIPIIVYAINISPESFYKGSTIASIEEATERIKNAPHAKIIDIGAKSTRPQSIYSGNEIITPKLEIERLEKFLPPIIKVAKELDKKVSIDTQSAKVAEFALQQGAEIVNDISGLKADENMAKLVAEYDAELVAMATKSKPGDPENIDEVIQALEETLTIAENAGIDMKKIAIDPGFGGWGGKSPLCDHDIIKNFNKLKQLNKKLYIAISRKSTIASLGGHEKPSERLPGTLAMSIWLALQGIDYLRTHDPEETFRTLQVYKNILEMKERTE